MIDKKVSLNYNISRRSVRKQRCQMMKIEMHTHTKEGSPCAHVKPEDMVKEYHREGYDGIVVTNHFNDYIIEAYRGTPREKVERYLKGYQLAKEEGEKYGIEVFFGIETCLRGPGFEDYLIYGAEPGFLFEYPVFTGMTQKEVYQACKSSGVLFLQAHPCRSYCSPQNAKYLDGIEVYNGNPRNINNNHQARRWASEHPEFILTSGSDYHSRGDAGKGGIITKHKIENNTQLKEALIQGVKLIEGIE